MNNVVSNPESLQSSTAPKPRRGRGSAGPPRNGFGRQFRGNHSHYENSQRQSYTSRNSSEAEGQPLTAQPDRNFSRNYEYNQQQDGYSRENQTRSGPTMSRPSQLRDQDANVMDYAISQPGDHISPYPVDSTQIYTRPSNELAGSAANSADYRSYGRGNSTRPKQTRGTKKPKFKNPEYRPTNTQTEGYDAAAYGAAYDSSSHQAKHGLANNVPSVSTLEYQPFDNIRNDYSQYNSSRSTFSSTHYEGGVRSRNPKERFRRDDRQPRDADYNTQEKFNRDESNGRYGSKDRLKLDEPVKMSSSRDRDQSSYVKPQKSYDSQNWRSDGFKKGFAAQKQKVVDTPADTATQRERLTTQLTSGTYECMVCCESVKPAQVHNQLKIQDIRLHLNIFQFLVLADLELYAVLPCFPSGMCAALVSYITRW